MQGIALASNASLRERKSSVEVAPWLLRKPQVSDEPGARDSDSHLDQQLLGGWS